MQQEQDTSDLTIVTAFFDIGRSEFKDFTRKNIEYFNYFKFWAGIKNNLVVYTQPEFKDEVLKIRQEKGLLDKTIVITCNLEDVDPELYNVFKETFEKYPQTWRNTSKENPEATSFKYCYVTNLKSFIVDKAIQDNLVSTSNIIWIDFGFNHKGDVFTNEDQFNFYLNFKKLYDKNKLVIYKISNDTNKSLAQIYYDMSVVYVGCLMYGSCESWRIYSSQIRSSILSFASKGMADDDQLYMIEVVRNNPHTYQVESCSIWFDSLLDFISTENCKLLTMSGKAYKSKYFLLQERILKETNNLKRSFMKIYLYFFRKSLKRSITKILHQHIKNKF